MEQVKRPLLVLLTSKILLGIIRVPTWGMGFIPQRSWACLENDKNLVEIIWASIVVYAKPLKVTWGVHNWTLKSNKHNWSKEMDAIFEYHNFEIIHGWYISIYIYIIFNIFCILTLESNLFFCFLVLGFGHNKGGFCCKCNSTCAWTSSIIYSSPCNKSYKSYNKMLHQYGHSF